MNLGQAKNLIEKATKALKVPIPDKFDGTKFVNVIKNPTRDDYWIISQEFRQKYPEIKIGPSFLFAFRPI